MERPLSILQAGSAQGTSEVLKMAFSQWRDVKEISSLRAEKTYGPNPWKMYSEDFHTSPTSASPEFLMPNGAKQSRHG
jgi:hypothetical protein